MTKILCLISAWLVAGAVAFAAPTCHVVTPSGSGTLSGADWNNAMGGLPSTLVRGDTYYVADGSYGSHSFNTPVSGTTLITVKKAVPAEHCTDTGWNAAAMGSGTATFSASGDVFSFSTSYITIDGMVGSGKGPYGIHLVSASTTDGIAALHVPSAGANLTFRHLEAENGPALNSNGSRVYDSQSTTSNNTTFQYVYFHGGRVWVGFVAGGTSNQLVEYSYFANAGSGDPSLHSCGFCLADMTGFTLRYSTMENMVGGSNTTYFEPQFSSSNIFVYGNNFWGTASNESTGQGIFAVTSTDTCKNCFIYNNTIVGLHTFSGIWCGNTGGQSIFVDNNLWKDNPASPSITGQGGAVCTDGGHEILNTGAGSFVNEAAGNFRLTADTKAGGTLSAPYNLDPDGNVRGSSGTWDIGAFQFVSGTGSTPPSPPTGLAAVVQ